MTTTFALIEAELQRLWFAVEELDSKIGGDGQAAIIFDDERTDLIARINALEALRLHYSVDLVSILGAPPSRGTLMARLIADAATANGRFGEIDNEAAAAIASGNQESVEMHEARQHEVGRLISALDDGLAAMRPKTADHALVSAACLHEEVVRRGITELNLGRVEMLVCGLLAYHIACAGKPAEPAYMGRAALV